MSTFLAVLNLTGVLCSTFLVCASLCEGNIPKAAFAVTLGILCASTFIRTQHGDLKDL